MAAPTIRNATPEDYPAFAELFHELGLVHDPVPSAERFVSDMMATTLLAEQGGTAVGYAYYRLMKEAAHLAQVVSAPRARRTGVGRALMAEVARRARGAGCTELALNVLADNAPAIRLYESVGLVRVHENHAFKMPWSFVEQQPGDLAPRARDVDPAEDEALEARCHVPKGTLAERRTHAACVLRVLTTAPDATALAVFDVGFPGMYPFRAPDLRHAWSLLKALRPFARSGDAEVHVLVEAQPELAAGFVAAGAKLKLQAVFMKGPIG